MHPEEGLAEGGVARHVTSHAVHAGGIAAGTGFCITPPDGHEHVTLPRTLCPPLFTPSSCPPLTHYPTLRAKQREMHCLYSDDEIL